MKVEEKTESFYILGYLLELIMKIFMAIWNFFPSKFGQNVFMKKCVYRSKSFFSCQNLAKFHQNKKTLMGGQLLGGRGGWRRFKF
jgi:hypothetical protein